MQVRFLQNLGIADALECKDATGVELSHRECVIDSVVNIPDKAAEWLGAKYKSLFEQVEKSVRGMAKDSAIAGVKS